MTAKIINVHIFDVSSESARDLSALLGRIHHTGKDSRWRNVLGQEVSLHDSRLMKGHDGMLLDFVKKREIGPGKVKRNGRITDFDFADDEDFGEETAALWDAQRKWLLVQYNHHGVRAPSIMSYLNQYEHDPDCDWIARPRLDPKAETRIQRTGSLRTATLKIELNDVMNAAMRDAGMALGEAIAATGGRANARTLELTFSMSREDGFLSNIVMPFARKLRKLVGEDDGLVKLEVKGRPDGETKDVVIDMLEQHLKHGFESRELEVKNRRYTLDSRWRALMRVHAGFISELG